MIYHAAMLQTDASAALTRINRDEFHCRRLFESLSGGPLTGWDRLERSIALRRIEPGGHIFMQGVEHPYIYVLRFGLVKLVYLKEDGDAWIKSFVDEGRSFASMAALRPKGRTSFAAVAIEPTEVERIDYAPLFALADDNLGWSKAVRTALAILAARKEKRERELLTLSAEERYRVFIEEDAVLAARAPQKDLALYVGVTPVGLNRIVKRVRGLASPRVETSAGHST